ncbi:MAG: 30S ribosomal protein S2 [Patescibacteria group bacterium]|nr:MAG: 30S ribosomal protein S2 [Patescibacteria group bacterium]
MAKIKISVERLFEAGAHFGHQTSRSHPKAKDYVYGEQDGVLIFDLVKTKELLKEALEFLAKVSKKEEGVLFLGTKRQIKDQVKQAAENCGGFFVNERWLGGTLTNFPQIKKSLDRLHELEDKKAKGDLKEYTKRERLLIDREIKRLDDIFGGLRGMKSLPAVLVLVDSKREKTAVLEAEKTGVPVVAIVDSNSDPNLVDYPIVMNDDSIEAVSYVLSLISEVVKLSKEGKKVEIE